MTASTAIFFLAIGVLSLITLVLLTRRAWIAWRRELLSRASGISHIAQIIALFLLAYLLLSCGSLFLSREALMLSWWLLIVPLSAIALTGTARKLLQAPPEWRTGRIAMVISLIPAGAFLALTVYSMIPTPG